MILIDKHTAAPDPQVLTAKISAVCMYCGKIRVAPKLWQNLDPNPRSCCRLSHSACPDCFKAAMPHLLDEIRREALDG